MSREHSGTVERSRLPGSTFLLGLAGVVSAFAILEAITRADLVDRTYLPPASTVLIATAQLLVDPEFLGHVASTMRAWAFGLGLAIIVAVPLGIAFGAFDRVYRASRALVELLRPIPSVALIPLAILLFGQGLQYKLSLILYASVWPILFNTIYGVHDVDPIAKDTARGFGFGPLSILRRVALPSAAPFVYTGIRVAAAVALILAISAELLAGGSQGIGTWMLLVGSGSVDRTLVYAGTVVTGLLGLAINWVLVSGERRLFAWHRARQAGS